MVRVFKRMRHLRGKLLAIRLGPGAAILPPEVTKIHMNFATDIHDGHWGPRRFWRNCLPRLKYWNPAVSMTVTRTQDQEGPALMTIQFTTPEEAAAITPEISSPADKVDSTAPITQGQAVSITNRVETINMKHRVDSEILNELLKLTNARVIKAKPEELREIAELERLEAEAERDQAEQEKIYAKQRRERAMLKAAQAAPGESVKS